MLGREHWNIRVEIALEECTGKIIAAVQWREHRTSAMDVGQEQCSGQCTGSAHWMYDWRNAVHEHWNSATEGRLESCGGRKLAMY